MRVQLHTLGCRLNEAETEAWARAFHARGDAVVGSETPTHGGPVDVVVVNTCAVTREALAKSRRLLYRVRRDYPSARLVVSGCAVSLPSPTLETPDLTLVVTNRDKDHLPALVARAFGPLAGGGDGALPALADAPAPAAGPSSDPMVDPTAGSVAGPLAARGRRRAFVKVQDGCRHRCSFCVTRLARGPEHSRPAGVVCAEIAALAAAGVQEVVLTGVHVAGWRDAAGGGLADLIAAVLRETPIARLRLGSVEPWGLPPAFWSLFAEPRLLPHLHLPLQSGADAVLRRMGRRCGVAAFAEMVAAGRAAVPDLAVSTDIIVGFPGESDADFARTLAVCAEVGFSQVHGFVFSPQPGTHAATLPNRVPPALARERAGALADLGQRLRRAAGARLVGRTLPVLIEAASGPPGADGLVTRGGYTPSYLPVRLRAAAHAAPLGAVLPVHIKSVTADGTALDAVLAP